MEKNLNFAGKNMNLWQDLQKLCRNPSVQDEVLDTCTGHGKTPNSITQSLQGNICIWIIISMRPRKFKFRAGDADINLGF